MMVNMGTFDPFSPSLSKWTPDHVTPVTVQQHQYNDHPNDNSIVLVHAGKPSDYTMMRCAGKWWMAQATGPAEPVLYTAKLHFNGHVKRSSVSQKLSYSATALWSFNGRVLKMLHTHTGVFTYADWPSSWVEFCWGSRDVPVKRRSTCVGRLGERGL